MLTSGHTLRRGKFNHNYNAVSWLALLPRASKHPSSLAHEMSWAHRVIFLTYPWVFNTRNLPQETSVILLNTVSRGKRARQRGRSKDKIIWVWCPLAPNACQLRTQHAEEATHETRYWERLCLIVLPVDSFYWLSVSWWLAKAIERHTWRKQNGG